GHGALATDAPPLTLAHAAPDAELLAVAQRVLEALPAHDAATTDFLRFTRGRTALRKEQIGVDTEAVGEVLPGRVFSLFTEQVSHVRPSLRFAAVRAQDPVVPVKAPKRRAADRKSTRPNS